MACEAEQEKLDQDQKKLQQAVESGDPAEIQYWSSVVAADRAALQSCQANPPIPVPLTTIAPTMVSTPNFVYLFVVNQDNTIAYTRWVLGGGGEFGWHAVPGEFLTDAAVGAASVGEYLFLTARGIGPEPSSVFINQGEPPNWVGWG